jgi:hypothetical protein
MSRQNNLPRPVIHWHLRVFTRVDPETAQLMHTVNPYAVMFRINISLANNMTLRDSAVMCEAYTTLQSENYFNDHWAFYIETTHEHTTQNIYCA